MDVLQSLWRNGDNLHQTELYVAQLLERGIRVLIYAGTLDWISNWVSCERWMLEMEWSARQVSLRKAKGMACRRANCWKTKKLWKSHVRYHTQCRTYGMYLLHSYTTLLSKLHQVPFDRPEVALTMINHWLENKQL